MDIDFDAVLRTFAAESAENLTEMEEALLALEGRPGDAELLHLVFRKAHTIKGDAGTLGFPAIADAAHLLEDVLSALRDGRRALDGALATRLLDAVDVLRVAIPAAIDGHDELSDAQRETFARLADARPDDASASPTANAGDATAATSAAPPTGEAAGSGVWDHRARTLRVDVSKLDRLLDLTGEIAIARGRLRQAIDSGTNVEDMVAANWEADRLYLELQEQVMQLRMVPLGPVFRRYVRTVRDVALAVGKSVRLEVHGEDVEVDTTVAEHLRDPLTHLLRNAIDHGIESADARRAAGKDPQGRLLLGARHEAGNIVLELTDDGAGFDRARILRRAVEQGLLSEHERPDDATLFKLVFAPGFSTAEAVTDISGRGVGLDVVRRNVELLRGTIEVESAPGAGTTVRIRLPLTLAIIEGFAVGAADETYVLPLDAVIECVQLPEAQRLDDEGTGLMDLRGDALPYVRLRHLFGLTGEKSPRENVVVVQHAGRHVGIAVDHLYGSSETVIKSLGAYFRRLHGVVGSTILGTGRVALILDVPAIIEQVITRRETAEVAS